MPCVCYSRLPTNSILLSYFPLTAFRVAPWPQYVHAVHLLSQAGQAPASCTYKDGVSSALAQMHCSYVDPWPCHFTPQTPGGCGFPVPGSQQVAGKLKRQGSGCSTSSDFEWGRKRKPCTCIDMVAGQWIVGMSCESSIADHSS